MTSRTFRVLFDGVEELMMAPLACLCNHSFDAALCSKRISKLDHGEHFLELRSSRSVRDGEEVYLLYGDSLPNWQLLLFYGFTLKGNPFSEFQMGLELPEEEEGEVEEGDTQVRKMLLLRVAQTISLDQVLNYGETVLKGNLSKGLMATLRLMVADAEDLENVTVKNVDERLSHPINARNETAASELLLSILGNLLGSLPRDNSSDELDNEKGRGEEEEGEAMRRKAHCLAYRHEQFEILTQALSLAQAWNERATESEAI